MTAETRWLELVNGLANGLYDQRLGWLLGQRFLQLTHVGRRSGRHYRTVLEVVAYDRSVPEFVVIAGFGRRSDWLRNLNAGGRATVAVGSRCFAAGHRVLNACEAFEVVLAYEQRHRLIAPVVKPVLSWLLGWRYRGTDADRHRLVG